PQPLDQRIAHGGHGGRQRSATGRGAHGSEGSVPGRARTVQAGRGFAKSPRNQPAVASQKRDFRTFLPSTVMSTQAPPGNDSVTSRFGVSRVRSPLFGQPR